MVEAVDDRYMHQALRSDPSLSAWNTNDGLSGAKLSFGSFRKLGGLITSS